MGKRGGTRDGIFPQNFTGQAVDALLGKREVAHYFNAYEVDVAFISEGVYACMGIFRRVCGGDPPTERCGVREHHKTAGMMQGSTKDDWDAKTWLANEMKRFWVGICWNTVVDINGAESDVPRSEPNGFYAQYSAEALASEQAMQAIWREVAANLT
ncbi:hypothetical protein ARMSODRAFT_1022633 [Armillaria solidipes]|uniref:Uncharacterized protein n=1 Tax=Armillaria solidipes TaxID=1076256 RepID=A0A2H3BMW8_9AGAR|nr:hypothetical protein ARMSODRAFT_1022633 [Armillaria solidipes]